MLGFQLFDRPFAVGGSGRRATPWGGVGCRAGRTGTDGRASAVVAARTGTLPVRVTSPGMAPTINVVAGAFVAGVDFAMGQRGAAAGAGASATGSGRSISSDGARRKRRPNGMTGDRSVIVSSTVGGPSAAAVRRASTSSAPDAGRFAGLRASSRWMTVTSAVGSVARRRARSVGIALQAGERRVGVGLAEERNPPGEALVEHEPERVQVGPPVELLAAHLLGREVLRRAHHDVVAGQVGVGRLEALGDPEVGQQDTTVGRDQDVAGLHVAVHEAGLVGVVERRRDARADVAGQLGAEALLGVEQLPQALAVDELHHHGLAPVLFEHVVHRDDVRVVQAGGGDGLAAEALGDDGVGGEVRLEPFHRHLAVEREVGGQPHLGHATLGELPLQLVSVGDDGGCR